MDILVLSLQANIVQGGNIKPRGRHYILCQLFAAYYTDQDSILHATVNEQE